MATNRLLGLPPVTPELKSINPYLQRADELKSQDPIMAYWCAYYAAQVGISLKAKSNPSRDVLFSLLGVLEHLKKDIGPNDAIDMEAASSAYVENFALRVFTMADNEDRSGGANRSTAKKFLAAANFLEVLKTFPKSEVSDSNEEKIRYAKWKAADIAKSFREGRKPTPGPAGQPQESVVTPPASPPPPANNVRHASPPQIKRSSPPAHIDISRASPPSHKPQPQTPPSPRPIYTGIYSEPHVHLGGWGGEGEATPGSWSTAATPGTGQPSIEWEQASPTRVTNGQSRMGSENSAGSGGSGGVLKKAWVSEELDPHAANQHYVSQKNGHFSLDALESAGTSGSDGSKKSVRFMPSDGATPELPPVQDGKDSLGVSAWPVDPSIHVGYGVLPPQPPSQGNAFLDGTVFPPGIVPDAPEWISNAPPLPSISPPSPPHQPSNTYYSPQPPQPPHVSAPQPVHGQPMQNIYTSVPPVVFDLTPSIIAKTQKHCRFAISALDYEDAVQARKELRAALAALGG